MASDLAANPFDVSLGCLSSSALDQLATQLDQIVDLGKRESQAILLATQSSLHAVLHDKLVRLLLLELNAARLDGRLYADNSAERWGQFLALSSQRRFWENLGEHYSGLLHRIETIVRNRCSASERFAVRWAADRKDLVGLGLSSSEELIEISFGAGDSHRGGQTVALLHCTSGRLTYKPRPVAVDASLIEFIADLEADLGPLTIRVPKVLVRKDYGWAEFVEHRYASDEGELRGFYRGIGHWLSLMRLLGGSDMHTENLIAHGMSPVVIDCETLFTPRLPNAPAGFGDALDEANRLIGSSVMSIGLLPDRGIGLGWHGVDSSAIGSLPGQQPLLPRTGVVDAGTDQARIGTIMVKAPIAQNHPSPDPALSTYWPDILGAFDEMNAHLQRLDSEGALHSRLQRFAQCLIRNVPRSTEVYSELMRMLWHPVSLHNEAEARGRAHDLLAKMASKVPAAPDDPAVIDAEIDDLLIADIPFFSTTPAKGCLDGPQGTQWRPVYNLLDTTLQHWRSADFELERHVIQAALVSAYINQGWRPDDPSMWPAKARTENLEWRRRKQIDGIMRKLMETAIHGVDGSVAWIAPIFIPNIGWAVKTLGPDLYGGTSGIALLLAAHLRESRAGRVDPIEGLQELFNATLRTLEIGETNRARQRKGSVKVRPLPPGGYWGLGSMIWTRMILEDWECGGSEGLHRARDIAKDMRTAAESTDMHDVLSGIAGAIPALLMLFERTGHDQYMDMAHELGDRLCKEAVRKDGKAFWTHEKWPAGIGGFAHGVTGVGWALTKIARATNEARYEEVAKEAFAFEDSFFDIAEQNWLDLRGLKEVKSSAAWCHGAVGIGLARLDLDPELKDESTRSVLRVAVAATSRLGLGWNHCACHGDLGAWELLDAAIALGEGPDEMSREELLAHVITSLEDNGPASGMTRDIFSPSLMPGLGGIAYQLLKAHPLSELPSILTMAVPSSNSGMDRDGHATAIAASCSGVPTASLS